MDSSPKANLQVLGLPEPSYRTRPVMPFYVVAQVEFMVTHQGPRAGEPVKLDSLECIDEEQAIYNSAERALRYMFSYLQKKDDSQRSEVARLKAKLQAADGRAKQAAQQWASVIKHTEDAAMDFKDFVKDTFVSDQLAADGDDLNRALLQVDYRADMLDNFATGSDAFHQNVADQARMEETDEDVPTDSDPWKHASEPTPSTDSAHASLRRRRTVRMLSFIQATQVMALTTKHLSNNDASAPHPADN